jgi:hypothetical protein
MSLSPNICYIWFFFTMNTCSINFLLPVFSPKGYNATNTVTHGLYMACTKDKNKIYICFNLAQELKCCRLENSQRILWFQRFLFPLQRKLGWFFSECLCFQRFFIFWLNFQRFFLQCVLHPDVEKHVSGRKVAWIPTNTFSCSPAFPMIWPTSLWELFVKY